MAKRVVARLKTMGVDNIYNLDDLFDQPAPPPAPQPEVKSSTTTSSGVGTSNSTTSHSNDMDVSDLINDDNTDNACSASLDEPTASSTEEGDDTDTSSSEADNVSIIDQGAY